MASCNSTPVTRGNSSTAENGKDNNNNVVKRFDDPQRINTCRRFLGYVKNNNISDAMSMIQLSRTNDDEINNQIQEEQSEYLEKINYIISKSPVKAEKDWIVRYDTSHYKVEYKKFIIRSMNLLENILIPIDRGNEPLDSQLYLRLVFDLTEQYPSPNFMMAVTLVRHDFLLTATNRTINDN